MSTKRSSADKVDDQASASRDVHDDLERGPKRRKVDVPTDNIINDPLFVTDPATKEDAARVPGYASSSSNEAAARMMQSAEFRASHTSAAGNDFIDGFYKNSRLHHLSTWKNELKLLVAEAQERAEKLRDIAEGFVAPDGGESSVSAGQKPSSSSGGGGVSTSMRGATLPKSPSKGKARAQDEKVETVIMHVDFDCFFVSVGLLDRPHLRGQPVVVCHSQGAQGGANSTSEISSANYVARKFGIKAGMSLQQARKLCPNVATIPYEFEKYKQMSLQLYTILMVHSDDLQAVSVDEALIDVSSGVRQISNETDDPTRDPAKTFAEMLRKKVRDSTGCEVSIGISHNIMLARLATRKAKPAGSFHLKLADLQKFITHMQVDDLHGFGRATREKALEKLGVSTLGELSRKPKSVLCDTLGKTTGETLYNAVRGIDNRKLESDKPRKSVSAEINYGIRFENTEQARAFMFQLSEEVARRLDSVEMRARSITLKIMIRDPNAPVEPPKFMGHGICTVMNKQAALNASSWRATSDALVIGQQAWLMLKACNVDPKELRGIGIQLQKLEKAGSSSSGGNEKTQKKLTDFRPPKHNDLDVEEISDVTIVDEGHSPLKVDSSCEATVAPTIAVQPPSQEVQDGEAAATTITPSLTENIPLILPSLSQVDPSALEELPDDLRDEITKEYRRRRSESLSHSRSATPARPLPLTDGSVLRVDNEAPLFENRSSEKRKTTNKGTPLSRITQALGPKGNSSMSVHKYNIFERAKMASSSNGASSSSSSSTSKIVSHEKDQPKKHSSVKVSMEELRTLGIDAQVFSALPVDLQLEQLARLRFERGFGKGN